ncbi:ATP-dependent nuclease [Marinicellulosiphila megalodicopiae]|uniref:ATP-dependent nuclease n=1 Tax=Marinicellulosiphila megalodicopiae TaxID=2724896 RepID=UPI003BB208DE
MRIKSIYISDYKNLKDFNLKFTTDNFLEIFVGKNGSGKSNFIEALIEIFRHLYELHLTVPYEISFDYTIEYIIDGNAVIIQYNFTNNILLINGVERATLGQTIMPENILIYYAGQNEIINNTLNAYEINFSKRIISADINESRKFIGINSSYKDIFLTVISLMDTNSKLKKFILNKLGIQILGNDLKVKLKRPLYASRRNANTFNIESNDDINEYWKLTGASKSFLKKLEGCTLKESNNGLRTEGYLSDTDTYQLYFSIESIQREFSGFAPLEFFKAFDNLKTLGILESLSISMTLKNDQEIHSSSFSDGQFQTIYLFAVTEIFKNSNCITLLDEPDSFLHPEWQAECVGQLQNITDQAKYTNHVLMTSHSAVTLIKNIDQRVRYFDLNSDGFVNTYLIPKDIAVKKLCSDIIKYSANEQILSVLNTIQIENKPVLFTEGSTDPLIIKQAWLNLFDEEMPFIPFYAFSSTYLVQLLTDARILNEMNGLPMFGLFDFDKAYDTWNGINGDEIELDANKGLIKKWVNGDSFAIMIPIPENAEIKKQVYKNHFNGETFGGNSCCEIEHMFYGLEETDQYFEKQACAGGNQIKFKADGSKTAFAQDIVPQLPKESFEVFRPILEFIKTKCLIGKQELDVA